MARIELPPITPDGPKAEHARAFSYRPAMAEAIRALYRSTDRSELDPRLHELVRYRIARINQCPT
jgi:alkylhydroperoxidase family enzyme